MKGRIPQQFIDELLTRIDIVEVIDARVPLRKSGRDYTARCPFHEEKSPSFTVSQSKQFYHCFGCGAHGTVIGFLMEYEHMDFPEAVEHLSSLVGMEIPLASDETSPDETKFLHEIMDQAASFFRQQLRSHPEAIAYLKSRGLSGEIAATFGIGYAPAGWDNMTRSLGKDAASLGRLAEAGLVVKRDNGKFIDRFRHRIMFPIRDKRGRIVGFGGRAISNDTPKYLNSPETKVFHKSRELYGLYECLQSAHRPTQLLVVEGYMDVIALAQFGVRNAVATLGTATSKDHLERLFRTTSEIVFCFDGDRAGRDAAWRALECALPHMREGRQVRFMFLPDGEDPDTLIRKEGKELFDQRIGQSIPFSTFFFETLQVRADITSIDGRAKLVELARPSLSKLPPGVFRHMMFAKLAEIAQIEAELVGNSPGLEPKRDVRAQNRASASKSGRYSASPVRTALVLLLQQPSLASLPGDPKRLHSLNLPGVKLLIDILELLRQRPHLNCSAILEHWRDRPEGEQLVKLAQWKHPVPDEGIEAEFKGSMAWLDGRIIEQQTEHLLAKARLEGLTEAEKGELRNLLAKNPDMGNTSEASVLGSQ